jgi:hypothetical protein
MIIDFNLELHRAKIGLFGIGWMDPLERLIIARHGYGRHAHLRVKLRRLKHGVSQVCQSLKIPILQNNDVEQALEIDQPKGDREADRSSSPEFISLRIQTLSHATAPSRVVFFLHCFSFCERWPCPVYHRCGTCSPFM